MPLYEFACHACAAQFEEFRFFSQIADSATCPGCGSGRTEKLVSHCRTVVMAGRQSLGTPAERLAGIGVNGPGTRGTGSRSSVLHNCAGIGCKTCGT